MTAVKVVLFVVFLILALVFAYYNMQEVRISLPRYSLHIPLFLVVMVSFSLGFVIAYLLSEIRYFPLKRYRGKTEKALRLLWTGHLRKAEGLLKSLARREELVPLYLKARREQGKAPDLDPSGYGEGIAETSLAEGLLREDPKRARELLEKALGKNWENLRARRILRSLYFIEGEHQKAEDLQRAIIKDTDPALREEERRVLASMISETRKEKALEEVEKLPETLSSMALLISASDEDKGARVFRRAVDRGEGTELLALLWERRSLSPRILEIAKEREDSFDPDLLALLYADMGMVERVEALKDRVSPPIKLLTERDREVCREVLRITDLWVCGVCGMGYRSYTPVCVGCLQWNRLKIKGGRRYARRLLKGDGEI
jgi:uncharacterized integral membrane protein